MTEEHRSDGRSIDEILAEARAELDKTPDEPQQAAEPGTPEPDDFTPDFGHTFDDYGEFEEPQPEEELPPEPPRKRHKRIVPLFVKIILYVVIVAVVSVAQVLFLSEVGGLILGSKLPLNIWELFVIFLERTIISLLIVCPIAHLMF